MQIEPLLKLTPSENENVAGNSVIKVNNNLTFELSKGSCNLNFACDIFYLITNFDNGV